MGRRSHTTIIQLLDKYMQNQYKKQEGYVEGADQSLIPTFPQYSLMRLLWREYLINLLLNTVHALYLLLECLITMYFTGIYGLLALSIVYPIYQIAVRGPILSFSMSAASFVHKELEVGHALFANAYLLGYVILSVCWCVIVSILMAPLSYYLVTTVGTSKDSYATNYMMFCLTLGGVSIIFSEGMTAFHVVEQRHVLILVHGLTRHLLKGIFLLLCSIICNKVGQEYSIDMIRSLSAVPIVAEILASIALSVWIFVITCQKTIYNCPLLTSLNILKQNSFAWQWKVYKNILLYSIPHYLKSLYEPLMLLVSNVLVARFFTNYDESATKRISLLFFYLFRHIFMLSSRSFADSYYTITQTYYFHKFYQCIESILFKLILFTYVVGFALGSVFFAISPFIIHLVLPINVADSYILSALSETKKGLLIYYCKNSLSKAAIAVLLLPGLDIGFTIQILQGTHILNSVIYSVRLLFSLVFVLIIGLMNRDNSSIENSLLIAEIPTAIASIFFTIEQIYEHIFLGRLEMFHAMTSKSDSSLLSAKDWAEIHQQTTESVAEKKSAYMYLKFIITGKGKDK